MLLILYLLGGGNSVSGEVVLIFIRIVLNSKACCCHGNALCVTPAGVCGGEASPQYLCICGGRQRVPAEDVQVRDGPSLPHPAQPP